MSIGRIYFGTDGIRGEVGRFPMTPDFVMRLGWAAGRVLLRRLHDVDEREPSEGSRPCVVIGKDTRLSGYMFESALEAGFAAAGVDVLLVGPLATPGIAYLARTFRALAGVVISASHNPFADNGVKFFSRHGQKLEDTVEAEIESMLDASMSCVASDQLGRARRVESASGRYIEFCKSTAGLTNGGLRGMTLIVDCANGATYQTAPEVFRELGATVHVLGNTPNGLNINRECGSTQPDRMAAEVVRHRAQAGIALDGDGDRCIMADEGGRICDGDQLLYVIAAARRRASALREPVVGTLMSNLGLALALADIGVAFERAQVGDRYVFECLKARGGNIGGESSGHLICLDRATTGDGTVSALQVLAAMCERGDALSSLVAPVEKCPQTLINVQVGSAAANDLMDDIQVRRAVSEVERALGGNGRVLLRPSGTEPLLRVMVEGRDSDAVARHAAGLAAVVEQRAAGR